MERIKFVAIITLIAFGLSSCFEENEPLWKETVVEFDAAVNNAKTGTLTYPRLTRVPKFGKSVVSTGTSQDPVITRTSGQIQFRVNLVGAHRPEDTTLGYTVFAGETTAVQGVHYNISGSVVIPANESYGLVTVDILNNGPSATAVDLVLELTGADGVPVSENYKRIGLRIAQN